MCRRWLTALTLVAVAACGGDDSGTGPVGSLNVGGTWNMSISNMSGSGASCSTSDPIRATIRQTGSSFTGTYTGGILSCLTPTESFSTAVGSGAITNGQVGGSTISFDLGAYGHHDGTLSGNSMSGSAEWTYDFGLPLNEVPLTGGWSATR
ncbi:MAG TPA: hypothetical protein VFB61_15640 [Gemmatimonadales bacterium]|nr:hypothetical protein [Gemmatimonadales bacterium]